MNHLKLDSNLYYLVGVEKIFYSSQKKSFNFILWKLEKKLLGKIA